MSSRSHKLKPTVGLQALTPREREFFEAIRHGMNGPQSAAAFGVSLNTAKFHLKNIYSKLGANRLSGDLFEIQQDAEPR